MDNLLFDFMRSLQDLARRPPPADEGTYLQARSATSKLLDNGGAL